MINSIPFCHGVVRSSLSTYDMSYIKYVNHHLSLPAIKYLDLPSNIIIYHQITCHNSPLILS